MFGGEKKVSNYVVHNKRVAVQLHCLPAVCRCLAGTRALTAMEVAGGGSRVSTSQPARHCQSELVTVPARPLLYRCTPTADRAPDFDITPNTK